MHKTQVSKEKKLTLLLLFWFFGLLSVHRFYTRKYLTGCLQLLTLALTGVLAHLRIEIFAIIFGGVPFSLADNRFHAYHHGQVHG